MSGRAGRRGKDDKGIVIMMVDEKLNTAVVKNLVQVWTIFAFAVKDWVLFSCVFFKNLNICLNLQVYNLDAFSYDSKDDVFFHVS